MDNVGGRGCASGDSSCEDAERYCRLSSASLLASSRSLAVAGLSVAATDREDLGRRIRGRGSGVEGERARQRGTGGGDDIFTRDPGGPS